jgi:hypothetical protein
MARATPKPSTNPSVVTNVFGSSPTTPTTSSGSKRSTNSRVAITPAPRK